MAPRSYTTLLTEIQHAHDDCSALLDSVRAKGAIDEAFVVGNYGEGIELLDLTSDFADMMQREHLSLPGRGDIQPRVRRNHSKVERVRREAESLLRLILNGPC